MIVCFKDDIDDYLVSDYLEVFNSFNVDSSYAKDENNNYALLDKINIYVNNKIWKVFKKNHDFSFDDIYRITKLVRRIILAEAHTDKVLYLDEVWDKAESTLFSEDEEEFEEMFDDE